MRAPLLPLLIVLLFGIAVDTYIYLNVRKRCGNPFWARLQLWISILVTSVFIVGMSLPAKSGDDRALLLKMWTLFSYATVLLPKLLAVIFDAVSFIPRILNKKRWKFLTTLGIGAASGLFIAMWWGALVNRFNIEVKNIDIEVQGLPDGFDGFKIVQFSDLHTGTFGADTTFVGRLVSAINAQNGDMVVFTGDIVNRHSSEMLPFVGTLKRLSAPYGVYAVLGNHDYGDYMMWPSDKEKAKNMELLRNAYKDTQIRLLDNETVMIHAGSDSIALIGVENIGDPPFHVYGSLHKAYPQTNDLTTKVLLSHNPRHWVDSIAGNPECNIALTLAGHTHAMQIGVAGMSPAVCRYSTWGGLYNDLPEQLGDSGQNPMHQLYVNIGAGTVGFPMRLGATPEITVITLRKGNEKRAL